MHSGKNEAAATELYNVQLAVTAAMAETGTSSLTAGNISSTADFGIGGTTVGAYLIGGNESLSYGPYHIASDGLVSLAES
jgi:type IV pilus assembly protein PilA